MNEHSDKYLTERHEMVKVSSERALAIIDGMLSVTNKLPETSFNWTVIYQTLMDRLLEERYPAGNATATGATWFTPSQSDFKSASLDSIV